MVKQILAWGLLVGVGLIAMGSPSKATAQIFQEVLIDSLLSTPPPVWFGDAAWGDYDADGDLDLMLTGNLQPSQNAEPFSQLFLNDGDVVVPVPNPPSDEPILFPLTRYNDALNRNSPVLLDIWQSAIAWADYDNDGDLDLLASGLLADGNHSLRLYQNIDDAERFALGYDAPGLRSGSVAWGDYDNDGDQDLIACGTDQNNQPHTTLYQNQTRQGGTFLPQAATGLDALASCSVEWGDYDNDGDLDLLMTGIAEPQAFVTRIYRNQGGVFSAVESGLQGLVYSTGSWGDYDADGDLDILVSGGRLTPFLLEGQIKVYRNDGGSFTDVSDGLTGSFENEPTLGRYQGDAAWGDFDNDGILDFLVTGADNLRGSDRGQVYRTAPNDQFIKRLNERFGGGLFGDAFWGDYDSDNDLDFFVIGEDPAQGLVIQSWRNSFFRPNTPPQAPSGLQATPQGNTVTLAWSPGNDAQTPTPGLTYNVRVGTTPGGLDIVAPMAVPETGRRLLSRRGNVDHNTQWRLNGLAPGTYYWSVQTLDNSYTGSTFAVEGTFTIAN